ncbi:MAG: manganese efflux pump MntP family protein [Oscillospiraceae bacterium]|nr:manganese efflux pump MntP family protein [Oscillospiraceae bacterium]
MSFLGIFFLAIGLAMDAFAVSVFKGLAIDKVTVRKSLTVGLYFGVFQAVMPLIGYSAATLFADSIIAYNHWVAFALLGFIGGKMIFSSFNHDASPGNKSASLSPAHMLTLAVATSIDALAVGVSFAFLNVVVVPAVLLIGITTLVLSMAGMKIGSMFGERLKSKAELLGGIILVMIGFKILFEHLGIF